MDETYKEENTHNRSKSLRIESYRASTFKERGEYIFSNGAFEDQKEAQDARRTNLNPPAYKQAPVEDKRSTHCWGLIVHLP